MTHRENRPTRGRPRGDGTMRRKCKNQDCESWEGGRRLDTPAEEVCLEQSGYCFGCAEDLACMLADEGMNPRSAWYGRDTDN